MAVGQGGSYPASVASATGGRFGRETETGGAIVHRAPTTGQAAFAGCRFFITSFDPYSQPPFEIGLTDFLSIGETEDKRGCGLPEALEWQRTV